MSDWAKKAIESLAETHYIDVSDLGLKDSTGELVEKIPYKSLSAKGYAKVRDNPRMLKVAAQKNKEAADMMYGQLVVCQMLQYADETLTEEDFLSLPMEVMTAIVKRIFEQINFDSPPLKN